MKTLPVSTIILSDGLPAAFAIASPLLMIAFFEFFLATPLPVTFYLSFATLPGLPLIILFIIKLWRKNCILSCLFSSAFIVLAIAVSSKMHFYYLDFVIFSAVLIAYVSACILILIIKRLSKTALLLYALFVCALVLFYTVPWTSRHSFLRDLEHVDPDSFWNRRCPAKTFAEVEQIMHQYSMTYDTRWFQAPTDNPEIVALHKLHSLEERRKVKVADGRVLYGHSYEARFNADRAHVQFHDGHVLCVSFSPD